MGIGGIGIWQLLIILVIVLLLFGTKKLKNLGGDLGGAIKGFKKAVNEEKSGDGAESAAEATEELAKDDGSGGSGETVAASAANAKDDGKPS